MSETINVPAVMVDTFRGRAHQVRDRHLGPVTHRHLWRPRAAFGRRVRRPDPRPDPEPGARAPPANCCRTFLPRRAGSILPRSRMALYHPPVLLHGSAVAAVLRAVRRRRLADRPRLRRARPQQGDAAARHRGPGRVARADQIFARRSRFAYRRRQGLCGGIPPRQAGRARTGRKGGRRRAAMRCWRRRPIRMPPRRSTGSRSASSICSRRARSASSNCRRSASSSPATRP